MRQTQSNKVIVNNTNNYNERKNYKPNYTLPQPDPNSAACWLPQQSALIFRWDREVTELHTKTTVGCFCVQRIRKLLFSMYNQY